MKKSYLFSLAFVTLGILFFISPKSYSQTLNSATDSVIVSSVNTVTNWGRGFRFEPTSDMWVIKIGKRVPAVGSYSWVIWDVTSQTKVFGQTSLVDNPGNYVYENCDSIVKLNSGTEYILELYGSGSAQYYYGTSSQIGQDLTYYDMRFCNSCDYNDYPTSVLTNYHYGIPDFLYSLTPYSLDCTGIPTPGTAQADSTNVICNSTTMLSLSGNSNGAGMSYQWQYDSGSGWVNFGLDTNTLSTPPIITTTQFRCVLTCTKPGGGTDTSALVTVNVLPLVVSLGNDTTICQGITQVLNAGFPGSSYLWNTSATTQTINITTPGMYNVKVTDTVGCIGRDTIAIIQGIQPINILPANIDLCIGDVIALNAGNTGSTFDWNTGATTQSITTDTSGHYSVLITSIDGCQLTSISDVTLRALPVVDLGADTSICPNASIILDAGSPGASYLWNTGALTQTIPTVDSGNYSVVVTNSYNCFSNDEKHIAFLSLAKTDGFNFIPLFYEDLGKVKFSPIKPQDVTSYKWDFGDGTPIETDSNPTHTYTQTGNYLVVLNVANGCGHTETAQTIHVDLTTGIVTLEKENSTAIKLFPNPARNLLIIENTSKLKIYKITIFNTIGRLVYQKEWYNSAKQTVDVSAFADGIYSVRILTNKGWLSKRFEIVK